MRTTILPLLCLIAMLAFVLIVWRLRDERAARAEMTRLLSTQPIDPPRFSHHLVKDLPEPVRRFFLYSIREGTPLSSVAEIEMTGQFGLGTRENPNYMRMTADQVLAAPHGFVWKMSGGFGIKGISGSDSGRWTRFWLAGLLPVARTGGTSDHAKSAFGRQISEAVFWTPAAVLPSDNVVWDVVDDHTARVTVTENDQKQAVVVTIDADGRPTKVAFQRWSNANSDNTYRLQRFGGYLSNHHEFGGFVVPTHVEAGNFIDQDDYFPFFKADVVDIRFPSKGPGG